MKSKPPAFIFSQTFPQRQTVCAFFHCMTGHRAALQHSKRYIPQGAANISKIKDWQFFFV
jgi:hypothetical protein